MGKTILTFVLFFSCWISCAVAQEEPQFYVGVSTGFTSYWGDNEHSPFNFNGDAYSNGMPYAVSAEFGYLYRTWGLGWSYNRGDYPVITQYPDLENVSVSDHPTIRHLVQLFVRRDLTSQSPYWYLQAGVGLASGIVRARDGSQRLESGVGPTVNVGVDFPFDQTTTVFIQANSFFSWPDRTIDGVAHLGGGKTDKLLSLVAGIRWYL